MKHTVFFDNREFIITQGSKHCKLRRISDIISDFEKNETQSLILECSNVNEVLSEFCSNFKNIEAAGTLTVNSNSEILVIHRNGKIDLPKGKIEKKETPEEAAVRETAEECGLDVKLVSPITHTLHTYRLDEKYVLKKTYWFAAFYNGTNTPVPQQAEGISMVEWVKKSQIESIYNEMYLSVSEVIKTYLQHKTSGL